MTKLNLRDTAVVDFETLPVENRPAYPPVPVGVALRVPGQRPRSRYLAWGHPHGDNNCSWADGHRALGELYDSGRPILFHHAKFDVDVGEVHMGLPRLPWTRYHDTLPQLFLLDPRAPNFQLKSSAERLLQQEPEERDAVIDWLVTHQPVPGVKLTDKPKGKHYAGAYIAYAPAAIVGPYAIGDVDRTYDLAQHALRYLNPCNMVDAYLREMALMPDLLSMETDGVRVDVRRLTRDIERYDKTLCDIESWLRKRLRIRKGAEFNVDSGKELAHALIACGAATEEGLGVTPTGKVQTNKEALANGITDPQILAVLKYRAQLCTCVRTFMKPWLETALQSNGLIYTSWHSTRTERGGSGVGTRTGRLSSTPNFQNIPKEFMALFRDAQHRKLPKAPLKLPPLPLVRGYIVPHERGDVLLDRDYSQQELRILGHYEDGVLCQAYQNDPWLDIHALAQRLINEMLNTSFPRKPIKNTGFGLIYGMGVGLLAEKIESDVRTAKQVRDAYLAIFPGLKAIYTEMKQRAKDGVPITTWGGREYYCEEPKWVDGRLRHFDYKLLNVLIQGSAADCTKEAVIRYNRTKPRHHRVLLTVHDEILISAPRSERHRAMQELKEAMESVEFDIPMLTEGTWSETNWVDLKTYDERGKRHARS